eukprot:CAMPEP_0204225342 /NCGR_PEP_ID=MMETSP0361-20130328/84137_1 /ASSEMBLY_ACC=CAM_ASM_000343 /TAXON_ID=268821 /ORGANISM="Scrippsiella Hangoei, Strain SHTV-5" /LENGTH=110 /DNA_ID=CAMNT_0051191781 /DNA_START=135 /DNA_END=464 /DNA_ORIENTATION=-
MKYARASEEALLQQKQWVASGGLRQMAGGQASCDICGDLSSCTLGTQGHLQQRGRYASVNLHKGTITSVVAVVVGWNAASGAAEGTHEAQAAAEAPHRAAAILARVVACG